MRSESDSMGRMELPDDALYGASTQRAVLNFPISGHPMPTALHLSITLALHDDLRPALQKLHEEGHDVVHTFDTFGWNSFRFVVPPVWILKVQEASGSNMDHHQEEKEGSTWVHFDGTGDCQIRLTHRS